MTMPSSPDWAAARLLYETTQTPVADICLQIGASRAAFDSRRKKETWRRQYPRPFPGLRPAASVPASAGDPVPASPPSPPLPSAPARRRKPTATDLAGRRRLIDRLVAAIAMKLEQLERRMNHDLDDADGPASGAATATDHERETRAIGALIDNLGKVTEIETGLESRARGGNAASVAELADEADRRRRELAQRLARLVEAAAGKP